MPKKKQIVSNSENVDIKLHNTKWNSHYNSAFSYLKLGLDCTKTHCLIVYTQWKCFNSIVQPTVDARGQRDKHPNSNVVAETIKLLADSSYDYQIMNRSRHTVKKYLCDDKTQATIISKLLKKLVHVNNSLYEVELAKAQTEHREPILVRFFKHQYAKCWLLQLYFKIFTKFCDVNKFEELELDTESPYLAPAKTNWKVVSNLN